MNLAIFDIDGTLTDTSSMDSQAYFEALEKVFGLSLHEVDLRRFKYSSDPGILNEILFDRFGRLPEPEEVEHFKNQFLGLLKKIDERSPQEIQEILGAKSFLQTLREESSWMVAIATGCFLESAVLKMQRAELPYEEIPIATCEDHIERTKIILQAIQRASEWYHMDGFKRVVYLGDGLWDVRAAVELDLPFVAVGQRVSDLLQASAQVSIRDFSDGDAAYKALLKARVPEV